MFRTDHTTVTKFSTVTMAAIPDAAHQHQNDCKPKEQDANRELGGRGEHLAIYPRATPRALPVFQFVFSVSARVWKKVTGVATVPSELVCTVMVTAESWLQVPRLKPPPQPMILMPVLSLAPSGQLVRTNCYILLDSVTVCVLW